MNFSAYDAWRLGLDEPETPFCTAAEFRDNLEALDLIEQAAGLADDPDVKALLDRAAAVQRDWLDCAEADGCGHVPEEDGDWEHDIGGEG